MPGSLGSSVDKVLETILSIALPGSPTVDVTCMYNNKVLDPLNIHIYMYLYVYTVQFLS